MKFKRILALALAALMLLGLLAACGGSKGSDVVGTYKLESITEDGETMDMADLEELAQMLDINIEEMFSLELKSDGTGSITIEDEVEELTWKESSGKVTLTSDGEDITGTYKDGRLTLEEEDTSMVFVKK